MGRRAAALPPGGIAAAIPVQAGNPVLAGRIVESTECLILRGEIEDGDNLNYLRDSVGLLTFLLDHGGITVGGRPSRGAFMAASVETPGDQSHDTAASARVLAKSIAR